MGYLRWVNWDTWDELNGVPGVGRLRYLVWVNGLIGVPQMGKLGYLGWIDRLPRVGTCVEQVPRVNKFGYLCNNG